MSNPLAGTNGVLVPEAVWDKMTDAEKSRVKKRTPAGRMAQGTAGKRPA